MTREHRTKLQEGLDFIKTVPPSQFTPGKPGFDFISWMAVVFPEELNMTNKCELYLRTGAHGPVPYERVAQALFGIGEKTSCDLFGVGRQGEVHPSLPVATPQTTPEQFARILEEFLRIEEAGLIRPGQKKPCAQLSEEHVGLW